MLFIPLFSTLGVQRSKRDSGTLWRPKDSVSVASRGRCCPQHVSNAIYVSSPLFPCCCLSSSNFADLPCGTLWRLSFVGSDPRTKATDPLPAATLIRTFVWVIPKQLHMTGVTSTPPASNFLWPWEKICAAFPLLLFLGQLFKAGYCLSLSYFLFIT